jgi:hypothetical protein
MHEAAIGEFNGNFKSRTEHCDLRAIQHLLLRHIAVGALSS